MHNVGIAIASIPSSRTGKDTTARYLKKLDSRFDKLSLADPLKSWASMIFRKNFHDDNVKTQFRQILQIMGTNMVREWDDEAWIDTAISRTALYNNYGSLPVVTDIRAANEVEIFKQEHYFMVLLKVSETEAIRRGWNPDGHSIELEMMNVPEHMFNVVIQTDNLLPEEVAQLIEFQFYEENL